jgi:hypothetical protein
MVAHLHRSGESLVEVRRGFVVLMRGPSWPASAARRRAAGLSQRQRNAVAGRRRPSVFGFADQRDRIELALVGLMLAHDE